jgi:hypothetical protein
VFSFVVPFWCHSLRFFSHVGLCMRMEWWSVDEVSVGKQRLVVADAGGLHALLALLGDEGDSLALLKGLEAVLL